MTGSGSPSCTRCSPVVNVRRCCATGDTASRARRPTGADHRGVQAFTDSWAGLAPSSRARTLAAVKPLLAFGQRTGSLPVNVAAVVKPPPRKATLAERILSEPDLTEHAFCMLRH